MHPRVVASRGRASPRSNPTVNDHDRRQFTELASRGIASSVPAFHQEFRAIAEVVSAVFEGASRWPSTAQPEPAERTRGRRARPVPYRPGRKGEKPRPDRRNFALERHRNALARPRTKATVVAVTDTVDLSPLGLLGIAQKLIRYGATPRIPALGSEPPNHPDRTGHPAGGVSAEESST